MVFHLNGTDYSARYRVAGKPQDRSMHISLDYPNRDGSSLAGILSPERADKATVVVNFYCGSQGSPVWCSVDGGERTPMKRSPRAADPHGTRVAAERVEPIKAMHMWTMELPDELEPGVHTIRVTAKDMFGQIHHGTWLIEIGSDAN